MKFELNQVYTETIRATFGDLSPDQLADTLQNGRVSSFLVYEHLLSRYSNLKRAERDDYPMDSVKFTSGEIAVVRMNTRGGASLNLHRENGVGRKLNREACKRLLDAIAGYILVDVTKAPDYRYSFVSKDWIPCGGKLSCELSQSAIDQAIYN